MAANAETRVVQSNTDQVQIMLDKGSLHAAVHGNGHTKWSVFAGPYEVLVVGTKFVVTWDREAGTLEVQVTKGEVLVKGRNLSKRGISVEAGNSCTVDSGSDAFAVYPTETAGSSNAERFRNATVGILQNKSNITGDTPNAVESTPSKNQPGTWFRKNRKWKQLYKARKYTKAVHAWKNEFGTHYGSASAVELYDLANAARYARNITVAKDAPLTIRNKYSKSSQAEAATYLLGKNAMELSHNPNEARGWFELYLRDYANGSMVEKAMGRLMQIYKESGRDAKANKMAVQYLERYPKGIFAKIAASMQSK